MNFPITRLGAAALAMSIALGAGAALAQNAPAAPAAPAGGAPPAQPGQQQIPPKVDLVSPEPQWVKLCGKEQTTGRDACQTMRDFATSADQPPMVSIQVFELQGEEKKKLRFMMLPIGMLLKPGFRVDHRQVRADRRQVRHVLPERLHGRGRDRRRACSRI